MRERERERKKGSLKWENVGCDGKREKWKKQNTVFAIGRLCSEQDKGLLRSIVQKE
jgi:hypothetical protein